MLAKYLVAAIFASLLLSAGCSTQSTRQEQVAVRTPRACAYNSEKILEPPPAWVCGGSIPGTAMVALGKSEPSLVGGPMYQESQASIQARSNLLENLRSEASKKILQYLRTSEADTSEDIELIVQSVLGNIDRNSLFGSLTQRSLLGPDGWFYVLVGMDSVKVDKVVARAIAASMEQDQDLWAGFAEQMRDADLPEFTNDQNS